LLLQELLLCQ